jgi:rod shape-determining protein MreC
MVIAVTLIVNQRDINGFVSEAILNSVYYPFFKVRNNVAELIGVAEENNRLLARLVETSQKISALEEVQRENERLHAVLGFELSPEYQLLPASVIAVQGQGRPVAVTINRGSQDTVHVDMPVINQQGLVGRVQSVTTHFATIQLLTDPTSRVAVRVGDSREMGIVKYLTDGGMVLSNFPIDGTINVGDLIISSGLGGVYPPGMKVGIVDYVDRPAEAAFCDVRLHPVVNFQSIEEVFIMRRIEN